MNIIKVINRGLMLLFLLLSFNAVAAKEPAPPSMIVEIPWLKIKLSRDGTGIVKYRCPGCDFKYLKITRNSKAERNDVEVSIQQAKSRAGKPVGLLFNPVTHEVQNIFWYDKRITE